MVANNSLCLYNRGMCIALCIDEGGVGMTLGTKPFHVNLRVLNLRLERIAFTFSQDTSILENHGIATINHILRRFAKATRGIDITAYGTCTLLRKQRTQVTVFPDKLIAGRAIENDISTSHRQVVAWRNRCPNVFADFHTETDTTIRLEQLRFC